MRRHYIRRLQEIPYTEILSYLLLEVKKCYPTHKELLLVFVIGRLGNLQNACSFILHFFSRYRYTAYRQFVRWIWVWLGRRNRKVLPSCVVNEIRNAFPSERYAGFRYPV